MLIVRKIYFWGIYGLIGAFLNCSAAKSCPVEKFPFVIEQGFMILAYNLNGVNLRLLYDCAANLNIIDTSVYRVLGNKFEVEKTDMLATGGAGNFKLFRSENYVKDTHFKGVFFDPAVFKKHSDSFKSIDGLIGGQFFFRDYIVEWNFTDQYLALHDSFPPTDTLKYSVQEVRLVIPKTPHTCEPFDLGSQALPSLPAVLKWKGQLYFVHARFDTGCPENFYCIVADSTFYPRCPERIPRLSVPSLQIDTLPSPLWAKTTPDSSYYIDNNPVGVYIGVGLFQQYAKIIIDWNKRRAYFYNLKHQKSA